MKFKYLIISALLFCSISASAQYREFVHGSKVGPAWHWMSSGDESTAGNHVMVGSGVGYILEWYFVENMALTSGMTYKYMRQDYDFKAKRSILEGTMPDYLVDVNRDLKATYLCVPAMFKFKALELGPCQLYAQAGVDIEFRTKATARDEYVIGVYHHKDEDFHDVKDDYRFIRSSLEVALGAEYEVQRQLKVFGHLVYNRALSNMTSISYSKNGGPALFPQYFAVEIGICY